MGAADVARLRFILSADSGGLKAGCKEGAGSLKDMSSQVGRDMGRMDNLTPDWKGLKKSARSLRFVGCELGGVFKGGIGDAIGIATAGAGLGPIGAAAAIGAAGINLAQQHDQELKQQRAAAAASFREARHYGIDAGTYRSLKAIAGDDAEFLDALADGMKRLKDAGPTASESLKRFGKDVEDFKLSLGFKGDEGERAKTHQLAMAERHDMEVAGKPDESWSDWLLDTSYAATKRGLHQTEGYEKPLADRAEKRMKQKDSLIARDELMRDPKFRTNRENFTERLSHLDELQKSGADQLIVGRATKDAIDEYHKAQGGAAGMAGAAVAGSAEAYSVVAQAQMGAAGAGNDVATTNDILEKANFPELLKAVKNIKADWRRADTAT
jgi:hypothetical protein